ncbi:MAG TPA: ferritin-like domain-containing protein [Verrucomicrobiae bacterium]|nr:ferritin-like domain-containing protein [Verrucomicrobiae bacterium]
MKVDRDEIVEDLNRLMAEEVEAFLRYFQMRYRLRGVDRLAAEKLFDDGTRETLEHAEAIAKQIRALGHIPQLKIALELHGGPTNLPEALAEMLEVERQALEAYKEVLPRVAGDTMLEDFIRKQISVETEHVQEIATLLE